ncbi:MAG: hypothetical protein K9N23_10940 [Akkermansiaceae bacterium]|nr:hypothetical protein [Akkermansiaceae bacterium]MCF7732197.1 hypothetical protein [Akkermansiaceae bacterium]
MREITARVVGRNRKTVFSGNLSWCRKLGVNKADGLDFNPEGHQSPALGSAVVRVFFALATREWKSWAFANVVGGFLEGEVKRADGVPTLTFRHYSVDGKVLNADVFRAK